MWLLQALRQTFGDLCPMSLFCLTACRIDSTFELKRTVLHAHMFCGSHTADHVKQAIKEKLNTWEIEKQWVNGQWRCLSNTYSMCKLDGTPLSAWSRAYWSQGNLWVSMLLTTTSQLHWQRTSGNYWRRQWRFELPLKSWRGLWMQKLQLQLMWSLP